MRPALERVLTILQATGTLLETMGRSSVWISPSDELPAHLLLIRLTAAGYEYILQLSCLDEWLRLPDDTPTAPWLQFYVLMPLNTAKADSLSLAQLLVRLNQTLTIGSFGLSEANAVHYSYRLPWTEGIGTVQLAQSVQLIELALALTPDLIAGVSENQLSLDQAQQRLEQKLLQLARSGP